MEPIQPNLPDQKHLDVPFSDRWDCHKDLIKRMYLDEDKSLEIIAAIMRDCYSFDANIRQYKYRLKKWEINKNTTSETKERAIAAIRKRARDGIDVGGVRFRGEELDKKRLRRHVMAQAQVPQELHLNRIIFGRWNLPYMALRSSQYNLSHLLTLRPNHSTPSDMSVFSPQGQPSPNTASSPLNAPTPMTLAIRAKMHDDRAGFLLEGRWDEFLHDMSSTDKRISTTWLYQFWLFAFKTSKHWGRGPIAWSPGLLRFSDFVDVNTTPNTPAAIGGSQEVPSQHPTSECSWTIHGRSIPYSSLPDVPDCESEYEEFDPHDPEESWPSWPTDAYELDLPARLQGALQSNYFSNISVQDLPLSATRIAQASTNSRAELVTESIGFAIMSRNMELVDELIEDTGSANLDLTQLFPFHLAAIYLDGSKSCCNIIGNIIASVAGRNLVKNLYINTQRHTVLDSLMMTIIKGHTSCVPADVDSGLRNSQRFAGEEIDICGRWDADSPCIRELNASGAPRVPFSWKHMFCHTSVQAVCHSISALFFTEYSPDINTPSGLFTKVCGSCHTSLKLGPLHTLILVTFYLAQAGCEGENLFGALACLVCLLVHGANPLEKKEISVTELLGATNGEQCDHVAMDPLELAEKVPALMWASWSEEAKRGWETVMAVLKFAQDQRTAGRNRNLGHPPDLSNAAFGSYGFAHEEDVLGDQYPYDNREPYEETDCQHRWYDNGSFYGQRNGLPTLWAAIQTEFLTYRRQKVGDPWISDHFNMESLLHGLKSGRGPVCLPLVEHLMVGQICECGRFENAREPGFPVVSEACAYYFTNMEDWKRSQFLEIPCVFDDCIDMGLD